MHSNHVVNKNALLALGTIPLLAGFSGCNNATGKNAPDSKPNIVYILADDLGYGDVGCYGQKKIETPNIDKLASEGMLFRQHYSGSAVSAPSRCVLLTGINTGRAQVRGNDAWPERGNVRSYLAMEKDSTLEGSRPVAAGTPTIGSILQKAGYKTAAIGKWGLGSPGADGMPNQLGIDYFYGYICQRQAHTYYPLHLWENDHRVFLDNDTVFPGTPLPEGADPYDPASYAIFTGNDYSPELMFQKITKFVSDNKNGPFFLYWAPTIPHLSLQAPQKWVDYYVKKFGDEKPYLDEHYAPCRYPRATYAAQITYLDEQIGQLVSQLKELGLYQNTLIIFSGDNGPTGPGVEFFQSAGPFNPGFLKGTLNEAGIREPMIAAWPGKIKPGSVSDMVSGFQDILPTLAEIAGAEAPENISGKSLLPTFMGGKQEIHEYLYWEFREGGGQMAVRMGNFKALRKNMIKGNLKWELYDLEKDIRETNDISAAHPEIIDRVNKIVSREHTTSYNKVWQFPGLDN
jgi:arylsulfatase